MPSANWGMHGGRCRRLWTWFARTAIARKSNLMRVRRFGLLLRRKGSLRRRPKRRTRYVEEFTYATLHRFGRGVAERRIYVGFVSQRGHRSGGLPASAGARRDRADACGKIRQA